MRARRGAFGMVVVELAPISQPHVLLPRTRSEAATFFELAAVQWREDDLVPRRGLMHWISTNIAPPAAPAREPTPDELRKQKEREAATTDQPWGWVPYSGIFGGEVGRVYMSTTGPRWRCCGKRFEDEHSPWCSVEGLSDPFPGQP